MLDMIIKGGRVVTSSGVGEWDIGISGEKKYVIEGQSDPVWIDYACHGEV